jgi:hypothetical protein
MEDRNDRHARNAKGQHGSRMMMAHRHDIGPRLIDAAVDHSLREQPFGRRAHRLGVEREFENVCRLDQLRRARARQQESARIAGMAQADVTEGIEHPFVRKHAARQRELIADIIASIGHEGAS